MEYVEVNLAVERPRIGAIRCNTHGATWEDLMASLSSSGFLSIKPYLRPTSKLRSTMKHGNLSNWIKIKLQQKCLQTEIVMQKRSFPPINCALVKTLFGDFVSLGVCDIKSKF